MLSVKIINVLFLCFANIGNEIVTAH